MTENAQKKVTIRGRHWAVRLALGLVIASGIAFPLCHAIDAWQQWRFRQSIRSELEAYTEYALGPENLPGPESFYPRNVVVEQPLVEGTEYLTIDEIGDRITDGELVMAVTIDGQSRAYPLNIMTGPSREIFNDVLAGRPIAATW